MLRPTKFVGPKPLDLMAEPQKQDQSESDSSNVEILRPHKLPEMEVPTDSSGRLAEDPVDIFAGKASTRMMSTTSGRCTIY